MNSNNIDLQTSLANSQLSQIIPPEIKDDEFYNIILNLASTANIKTVLEIGSSSGEGSTEAFVIGLRNNPNRPTLFCMELSKVRFSALQKRYSSDSFVKPYNVSSVNLDQFPEENQIIEFYNTTSTELNNYPLQEVIRWLYQDIEYVKSSGVPSNGIKIIKQENQIEYFDFVLIDGSEFTGSSELNEVYGAKYIALDDTNIFKNYHNRQKLIVDPNYTLIVENSSVRNGYAIFKKNECIASNSNIRLPVHFFTIVLNGVPFIHYHIEVFKQLPFQWHWHIVEGVADLKHDTAWSLDLGGHIADELHHKGLSNDGTTEYLNTLKEKYPENVTIYRQPEGIFWDGKREMVNAPLPNINEECLLWQIDVDELWTLDQVWRAQQMFIDNPNKTAAWYWCWYFVGENLVISTRNCYAHNPQQEWLRTWRFKPGMVWEAHEPPRLVEILPDGQCQDVAAVNPFLHEETEQQGLIFHHFAYVTVQQLQFKEKYYGYQNAVSQWMELQTQTHFPVLLRQYLGWVHDETMVNTSASLGVLPLARKEPDGISWKFGNLDNLPKQAAITERGFPKVVVDGVFFQLNNTGIARVWKCLLEEWASSSFGQDIVVLDRQNTAPKIHNIRYRTVARYDYDATDADRQMLQKVCDEEGADLFISTYYTTPISTPSVFMAYDMIPELVERNLEHPMWREKHYGIEHASAYISISKNTARNLVGCFPSIPLNSVTVAHCGIESTFCPANPQAVASFKSKKGISKPYFLWVGDRMGWPEGYKNARLFFRAFAQLPNKQEFDIICTGGNSVLEPELTDLSSGVTVHLLYLSDEELKLAYSGAISLVYTSLYEGFGMPILEAMACGCPVITCPYASLPEVAGTSALYVNGNDVSGLVYEMIEIQKPEVRNLLISSGLERAKLFSWSKMAEVVTEVLTNTASKKVVKKSPRVAVRKFDNSAAKQKQALNNSVMIVTSIAPGNIDNQRAAVESWKFLGFSVVSLNSREEVEQLEPIYKNVVFQTVDRDARAEAGKPLVYIDDIFSYLRHYGTKVCGIVNSDIRLKGDQDFISFICNQVEDAIVLSSRLDIDSSEQEVGEIYKYGFDVFFFDKKLLEQFPPSQFCLGLPWWDYFMPIVCAQKGVTVKYFATPIAYHVKHPVNYRKELWLQLGIQFIEVYQPDLLKTFREMFLQNHDQLTNELNIISEQVIQQVSSVNLINYCINAKSTKTQVNAIGTYQEKISEIKILENSSLKLRDSNYLKVSAIVSTYNSEKFICDCLQDLIDQTLYKKGLLEIIVIDSASEQNEQEIVREFQKTYPNIVYDRTSERESLYASWNKAIKMSCGAYITSANTDDRHRPDALEVMANYLDRHSETSLVYADQLITTTANDTWATTKANQHWNWPSFDYSELERRCILGSQPMWRKSLHKKYGYFRSELTSAGDYEFWLRIGKTENIVRLPEILGLYYKNQQGLEHASPTSQQETHQILEEYGIPDRGVTAKMSMPAPISPSELQALPYRTTAQPLVSVIIPTKDRPEMLAQAVKSVLNQTFHDIEIIVINDGGIDVQNVLDSLNLKRNIIYLKHDRNLDRSAARNTGIHAASGKYIAYLDDDDTYHPNHVETLVNFLQNSEHKVAYTDAVMAEQQKQDGKYVTINRTVPYSLDFDNDKILVNNFIPILCLMHEKSCLDEAGAFDVNLGTHEDWDLLIRLSRKFRIAHIKETTCEFVWRNDGSTTTSNNRVDFFRTRELIYQKYNQYTEGNSAVIEAQNLALQSDRQEALVIPHQSQPEKQLIQSQLELTQYQLKQVQAELERLKSKLKQNPVLSEK